MPKTLSASLNFLFSSIKTVVNGEHLEPEKDFDEKEVLRKLQYHSIRLIVNEYLPISTHLDRIKAAVKAFAQNQAFLALQQQVETQRLFELFYKNSIRAIPYKGNLYSRLVYKNKQLREYSDIDILFHPCDAPKALELLLADGYTFSPMNGMSVHGDIKEIFDSPVLYELPLFKKGLHVDFHWGLHYNYLPFKVNIESCFERLENRSSYDEQIALPSNEMLFLMMIGHHGGKEAWLKLKNIVDLMVFIENVEIDQKKAIALIKEARLLNSFRNGLYYAKTFANYLPKGEFATLLESHLPKNLDLTISFWENAIHWSSIKARIHFERVLLLQQDENFSKWKYFRDFYKAYSVPMPYELKRFVTFPKQFYFLNFLSKVYSYLVRRTF